MFGSTPPFTRRERRVFWIATTAGFFNQYDFAFLRSRKDFESPKGTSAPPYLSYVSALAADYAVRGRVWPPPPTALYRDRLHGLHRT